MLRNIDAALDTAAGRAVAGFFIVEGHEGNREVPEAWRKAANATLEPKALQDSLPHRTADEQSAIADAFLGVTSAYQTKSRSDIESQGPERGGLPTGCAPPPKPKPAYRAEPRSLVGLRLRLRAEQEPPVRGLATVASRTRMIAAASHQALAMFGFFECHRFGRVHRVLIDASVVLMIVGMPGGGHVVP
jgi:hypothetical protein